MWTARQIKALRLAELAAIRRLIGGTAAPVNTPSEWIGWQVIVPDAETRRYLQRAARGLCTRCGNATARPGRKTCAKCAEGQRERSAALRARRRQAGICADCGQPSGLSARCSRCLQAYRGPGRWARRRGLSARHMDYTGPPDPPGTLKTGRPG